MVYCAFTTSQALVSPSPRYVTLFSLHGHVGTHSSHVGKREHGTARLARGTQGCGGFHKSTLYLSNYFYGQLKNKQVAGSLPPPSRQPTKPCARVCTYAARHFLKTMALPADLGLPGPGCTPSTPKQNCRSAWRERPARTPRAGLVSVRISPVRVQRLLGSVPSSPPTHLSPSTPPRGLAASPRGDLGKWRHWSEAWLPHPEERSNCTFCTKRPRGKGAGGRDQDCGETGRFPYC